MKVSVNRLNGFKNRDLKLDKKDLGDGGVAYLGLYSEGRSRGFHLASCLMSQGVPITRLLMKESGAGKEDFGRLSGALFINRLNQAKWRDYSL